MLPVDAQHIVTPAKNGTPAVIVRHRAYGLPVTLAALPECVFVVHRSVKADGSLHDDSWSVSEQLSGMSAGFGATAEDAIIAARTNCAKASPESLAKVRTQIAASASFATAA